MPIAERVQRRLRLLQGIGVELEYMIVDRQTLAVKPVADEVLRAVAGRYVTEVELGDVDWSNELALHVIEIKTGAPVPDLDGLARHFGQSIARINALLEPLDGMLMPTAMHPWMDPLRELRLWPHQDNPIYQAFDRIFDCKGHGWANLQSTHINLAFGDDDDEFGRLHAAIRVLLPILPALAASSPLADGRPTGWLDTRLEVYRTNAARIPSVTGEVVPERLFRRADYEQLLLQRIYADLAPYDPAGTLRHEWANARGCIARFDRGSIEIRLLDIQECPSADLAITAAVVGAVRALTDERLGSIAEQQALDERELAAILRAVIRDADEAPVSDAAYLRALRYPASACTAGQLWRHICNATAAQQPGQQRWMPLLQQMLDRGCLARAILRALGPQPTPAAQRAVYRRLCECLAADTLFSA